MDTDMPPPPAMPARRPAKQARVLPPVPVEPQQTEAGRAAVPAAAAAASEVTASGPAAPAVPAADAVAPAKAAPAGASRAARPPEESKHAPPAGAALPAGSLYTLPQWSAAPLFPYSLSVVKDGRELEVIPLRARSHFLLGRAGDLCDLLLEHASVSRRHAVLQFHEEGSLWLYDLAAAHGTFINRRQVEPHTFVQVRPGDQLKFGASTRSYIVEGPDEHRPKEVDREKEAQKRAALQQQQAAAMQRHREAQLAEAKRARTGGGAKGRAGAGDDDEQEGSASWGMDEDAVDSEDEGREGVISAGDDAAGRGSLALPASLTAQQQKLLDSLSKKREKLQNLATEIDVLRAKDIRQGGLSEGQERQISKNEERINALGQEVEELEEQLQESIQRVEGDRAKNRAAVEGRNAAGGKKRRRSSDDDDDAEDEDDDFYDRTRAPSKSSSSGGAAASSTAAAAVGASSRPDASSVLASLTPLGELRSPEDVSAELRRIELKRDQLRHTLQEVAVQEQREKRAQQQQGTPQGQGAAASTTGAAAGADSLDSFMSALSTSHLASRKSSLKTQLTELQTHYIRLQRVLEQKKGERVTKQYLEGDKEAFAKARAEAEAGATKVAAAATSTAKSAPVATATSATTAAPAPTDAATAASAAQPQPRPAAAAPAPAPAPSRPVFASASSGGGVLSTAEVLARAKKKQQEALARKIKEDALADAAEEQAEQRRKEQEANRQAGASSAATGSAAAPAASATPAPSGDRYAQLAAALEAARGRAHPSASSASGSTGGLHIRPALSTAAQAQADSDAHAPGVRSSGPPRVVGPSAPSPAATAMQQAHAAESVEWTPPVAAAAAGQEKLRAKFAGRY